MTKPSGKAETVCKSLRFNSKMDRNLAAYVAAATAAGVSLLAATPSAEAKIVYTAANQALDLGGPHAQLPLDINGDGIPDIYFTGGNIGYSDYIAAGPAAGNGIVGAPGSAAALAWGTRIGPKDQFETTPELMQLQDCKTNCTTLGPWAGKYDRFLGVKFVISGQTHYGWVNLDMKKLTIIGYAYETVPNKPIVAGEKTEPTQFGAVDPELLSQPNQPATLDLLARGGEGLAIWRREVSEFAGGFLK